MNYPHTRLRRLRQNAGLRALITEHELHAKDLIQPYFLLPGKNRREPIATLPGIDRLSLDLLFIEIELLLKLGICAIVLFPIIPDEDKTLDAKAAFDDQGLIPTAIRQIKKQFPSMLVITDVALDPYTSHGQDGVLDAEGNILNDETVEILVQQALSHARAGADMVGPSDMMDGRVGAIRLALEENNFKNTCILAYSAKYASHFYGPFRDAVGSKTRLGKADKKTYQMNPANIEEALREVEQDIEEGADVVMIKPGTLYLDVLHQVKTTFQVPTFAYHVSGEYAMLKFAAQAEVLSEKEAVLETLLCFKRAGADAILTYYAKEAARWLLESSM